MSLFMLAPQALAASTIISATLCEQTFIAPELTAPADGLETTGSTTIAAGTVEPDMVVDILRNGVTAASVTAAPDGSFGVSVPLVGGTNELQASASNPCGLTQASGTVTVTRIMPPEPPVTPPVQPPVVPTINPANPSPVVPNPSPGGSLYAPILNPFEETVDRQRIWVDGIAPPSVVVTISVNDEDVANVMSAPDGSFGVLVTLKRGVNTIVAKVITAEKVLTSIIGVVNFMPNLSSASPTEPDDWPISIWFIPLLMVSAGVGFSLWWLLLFHKLGRHIRLTPGPHARFR